MGKFKYVIIISLLLYFTNTFSQSGCARLNTGNPQIYIDLISGYTTRYNILGDYVTYNSNPPLNTCTDFYISRSSFGVLGSCGIYSGTSRVYNGYMVNYTLRCPLDDYLWLLILPIGAIGIYDVRKQSIVICLKGTHYYYLNNKFAYIMNRFHPF